MSASKRFYSPKRAIHFRLAAVAVLMGIFLLLMSNSYLAYAQSGNGYQLYKFTVDAGGGMSNTGLYMLQGTVGQPEGGKMSGGMYTLDGGFWTGNAVEPTDNPGDEPGEETVFLPFVR